MATKKDFINGKPEPITPVTTDQIVEDNTPCQVITSGASDYDENEQSDDLAALDVENELAVDKPMLDSSVHKEGEMTNLNDAGEQEIGDAGEDEEA